MSKTISPKSTVKSYKEGERESTLSTQKRRSEIEIYEHMNVTEYLKD